MHSSVHGDPRNSDGDDELSAPWSRIRRGEALDSLASNGGRPPYYPDDPPQQQTVVDAWRDGAFLAAQISRCGALAFGYLDWETKVRGEGHAVRPKSPGI